jgi:hypothetical protein
MSAIGTLVSLSESASVGPVFHDRVSMVGDAAYPALGSPGFQAALRTLRGDSRTVLSAKSYREAVDAATGLTPTVGYKVSYNADADKLVVNFEDQTSGVQAEPAPGSLATLKFFLEVTSK